MTSEKPWRDENTLKDLYIERELSTSEIAEKLGCTNTTISRWLKKHNISTRGPGGVNKIKKLRDEEWLREQYKRNERTTTEIAEELGTTHRTVLNWLKKHNIETRIGGPERVEKLRNADWLRQMYLDERRTVAEIAEELGCSDVTVSNWLNYHDIETRLAGPDPIQELRNEDWVRDRYQDEGLTAPEIADNLDCGTTAVYRWLDRHGIERTDPVEFLRDRKWLEQKYLEEGKTASQIAELSGTSETSALRWLREHQIEIREAGTPTPSELTDESWLRTEYIEKERTVHEIAKELDCASSTVANWIHRHQISSRKGGPTRISKLREEDWLREKYKKEGKSGSEIAAMLGCTPTTVTNWLNRHGIDTRPASFPSGPANPSYTNGTTDVLPFGDNWEEQRRKARKRDDHTCQKCGMAEHNHRQEYGTELHVHHITPRSEFIEGGDIDAQRANSLDNLITLCSVCHGSIESTDGVGVSRQND